MTTAAAEARERVGPYQVVQAIGAGGSARIDLARIDRAYGFQRHVVIKRPLEHLRTNPQVAASLRREARIGGLLRHPNLVAILDAGVHDGYDYLVLEYVHGASLRSLMQTDVPGQVRALPLAVALAIVTDVARGMHEAHELTDDRGAALGLVHRDVSPGNILLGHDGTVKLADFGIAKETRVSTLSGSMHGTVTYMAPEQCQGHAFDRRADVFSLGVILYELVTGARLFWADNDVASLHRVLSGAVPRPRKLRPELPSALEDIVLTAVAHQAERRYPTALELATALELYAAGAGEVIGARWIARTMEDVVGRTQVPWIAGAAPMREAAPGGAAAATEAAPRDEGSLVELIASAGPDEPSDLLFGEPGDEPDEAVAPGDVAPDRRREVGTAEPPHSWLAHRRRMLFVAAIAVGVIGGATFMAWLRPGRPPPGEAPIAAPVSPRQPSMPAPASPGQPSTPAPASRGQPSTPAPAFPDQPSTGRSVPASGEPALAVAPAPRAPSPTVGTKRRPRPTMRPAPPVTRAAPRAPDEPAHDTASAGVDGGSAAGSAQPPAPPAAKVEWKPTLLLPTDGTPEKRPK